MPPEAPHPSREDLFAYRDGELTADRRVLIEAHVVTCRFCRDLIDQVSSLEADLKSRPEPIGEEYFDRLTEKVLRRVKAEAPAPRAERRKSEAAAPAEEGDARPRLRLFWPAVISTATAAAAILVVVMLVAKEGAFWRPKSPKIATIEESAPDAGARGRASQSPPAGPTPAPSGAKREADTMARADQKKPADGRAKVESRGEQLSKEAATEPSQEPAKQQAEAKKSDATTALGKDRGEEEVMAQRAAPAPAALGAIGGVQQNMADGQAGSPQFDSIRSRYGLPPDWGPGVSDEMILRAEGPLRNLYRTGGATTALDSARVRLYLAEAARTRVGSAPDSAAIDEIAHHYRRVIRLAGPESSTGKVAAERLADFLQEVGLTP